MSFQFTLSFVHKKGSEDANITVGSVVPRIFGGIPVHTSTVYLSGTERPPPWSGTQSKEILGFKVARLALNALPSLI